jgi:hypothetical protein
MQQQLQAYGVRYQNLTYSAETGLWTLRCSVLTDSTKPDLLTTYTATSSGDRGLGAMRDLLQRLEQDRQGRR